MKTLKKYYKRLRRYVAMHPARAAGYFSTFTIIVNNMFHFKSISLLLFLSALIIGMGESAQRMEDKKTIAAIYTNNDPDVPDNQIMDQIAEISYNRKK